MTGLSRLATFAGASLFAGFCISFSAATPRAEAPPAPLAITHGSITHGSITHGSIVHGSGGPGAPIRKLGANPAKAKAKPKKKRVYRVKTKWSKSKIVAEQAKCAKVLRGLDIETVPLAPFRRNSCGAAAPVKLISIGSNPKVMLKSPPIVTCQLAAGLHKWVKRDIQPMARKYLGAPIKYIDVMSDYSCRGVYGRRGAKLSQHARANALDIRGFRTESGMKSYLLAHWGPRRRLRVQQTASGAAKSSPRKTQRKTTRRTKSIIVKSASLPRRKEASIIAAAKRAERRRKYVKTVSSRKQQARKAKRRIARADTARRSTGLHSRKKHGSGSGTALGLRGSVGAGSSFASAGSSSIWNSAFSGMNKLGGPRVRRERGKGSSMRSRSLFLRSIHARACSIFGTVLGPNANYAHRHHFHVDMQKRRLGHYCR